MELCVARYLIFDTIKDDMIENIDPIITTNNGDSEMRKYHEAKARITTPDSALISSSLSDEGAVYGDRLAGNFFFDLSNKVFGQFGSSVDEELKNLWHEISDLTRDKTIVDIGSGADGPFIAQNYLLPQRSKKRYGLDAGRCILVDPFAQIEQPTDERIIFEKIDALSFLLRTPNASVNIFMCNIDRTLISTGGLLERIAQEIFRVVPDDGIFISVNCSEIEKECESLFPYAKKFGMGVVFSKKEL